jgi:heat shock protein HslJ
MKKTYILVLVIVLFAGIVYIDTVTHPAVEAPVVITVPSAKNATYVIDGKPVTLKDGISEIEAAPGSTSKIVTKYFGNEVTHDFNGDQRDDVAFIITQETGGSGTFFYVVAALNTQAGYVGSDGVLLGDRIAPQTTSIGKGNIIVVNYADRKPSESFAVQPSIGKSIWLLLDTKTMKFGEVAQNFEGEADSSKMTLTMKTWSWVNTVYNNGSTTIPKAQDKFKLTFTKPNRFSASTDCNGVGGEYTATENKIVFDNMMSTLMYCDNSQEGEFSKALGEVSGFYFTGKGELVLDLKFDSGSMMFK